MAYVSCRSAAPTFVHEGTAGPHRLSSPALAHHRCRCSCSCKHRCGVHMFEEAKDDLCVWVMGVSGQVHALSCRQLNDLSTRLHAKPG